MDGESLMEDVEYVLLTMKRALFAKLKALLTDLGVNLLKDSLMYGSELLHEHGRPASTVAGRDRNITLQRAVLNSGGNDSQKLYTLSIKDPTIELPRVHLGSSRLFADFSLALDAHRKAISFGFNDCFLDMELFGRTRDPLDVSSTHFGRTHRVSCHD